MRTVLLALGVLFGVIVSQGAQAANGSQDEAKAMATKAAAYLQENGADKAFAVFNDKTGPFIDRDLYVYALDAGATARAHPISPALVGKSLADLKDVDGKPFVREILAIADSGWVDYKWMNPQTKQVEQKTAYVVKVGEYHVAVGAYKE
jgi:cytochrome c